MTRLPQWKVDRIFELLKDGLPVALIAERLGIAVRTVNHYKEKGEEA